jgi:membrane protein required for beta-lactamase induction
MSPTDSDTRFPRKYGPVQIISTSLGRQLLGFVLAFIGISLISWVVGESLPGLSSTVFHTAIGTFAIFNGLYLGGVRFR